MKTVTNEDMREVLDRCDERYVKKDDCDETTSKIKEENASIKADIAVMEYRMKISNWLLTVIASGIIALVINTFAGG